jgi:putative ABC transport system permease protein
VEPAAGLEAATLFSSVGLAFLPSQIGAVLMGSIGMLGLLLAAIGLYGVLAYSVARRTREIGIRIAVGATGREISRMILLEASKLLAMGSLSGFGIALAVTRPLAMFLVPGLSPSDPTSFASVMVVLAGTGLLASLGPVRRAIAIDPMRCLRYE